jgi:hypothetical protein
MTRKRALQAILLISVIGVGFSGTLTYGELCSGAAGGCSVAAGAGTILGYPACLYGLIMYLALVVVAALGLRAAE